MAAPGSTERAATAASPLADDIEFLALKAFAAGTRTLNARLAPLGLRARSYSVLALACGDRPVTQRQLADVLELDPSQITGLVDALVEQGLVERSTSAADRRLRVVRALPAGRDRFAAARALAVENEREALGALADDERESLRGMLRAIVLGPEP